MWTMLGSRRHCCDGISRRETLKVGALSALGGLGLVDLLRAQELAPGVPPKAKSVIVLYLLGGAPTQDMYDLKPQAAEEVRGEFRPISTSAPGVEICELLPRTAQWMHRAALVRTVNHTGGCHNTLPSYTGYGAVLPDIVSTRDSYPPSMGSICEYLNDDPHTPAYFYLPCYLGWGQAIRRPGPYAGFLGKRFDPLFTECEPYVDNPPDTPYHAQVLRGRPVLPNSKLLDGMTIDRLDGRRDLLAQIDDARREIEPQLAIAQFDRQQRQAWDILLSSRVRDAFDLDQEPTALRERYGNSLFGASTLVARRLVEAGVRFVNVTWDCYWERLKLQYECWDTHERNAGVLRDYNLPQLDLTYSALIEDLDARGLLDETLVVVMSDFGRTARHNAKGGRDHWTHCYSVLLAGAGIRGGTIHGASDAQAAFPKTDPVSPGDVCATIYRLLGIDPAMRVRDAQGRPVEIAHGGRPIESVLA
ncbi:MAG: DUF1501 domain-containing protein [Pirellulales bacterium]|nr:DUF1501 domain-containing protein [Pirellulales bacterium]